MTQPLDLLRYPIGPIGFPDSPELSAYVRALKTSEAALQVLASGLNETDLERSYRLGGFTVRQLLHHLADSHELGFMRFRWGLTEDAPIILPMDQDAWAALPDYRLPIAPSLALFGAVNARWVAVLAALDPAEMKREIVHPLEGRMNLWRLLAKHEWHVRHHMAHIGLALQH
jgi:DinB superfamily